MQDMLNHLSNNGYIYGYIILFFYTLGGGMVAIIAAGVLSYAGKMDIGLTILIASISNILGDTLLFYLSRYNRAEIMPYLRKQRRNLALSSVLIKKHGDKIIFIQKYIYGLKTLVPLAIGLTKYPFKKFTVLNVISSIIWALSLGLASYFAGEFFMRMYEKFSDKPYIIMIFMATLFGLIYIYFKINTKKRRVNG